MSIGIHNYIALGQALETTKDSVNNDAPNKLNQASLEANQTKLDITKADNATVSFTNTTKFLQQLEEAIINAPAEDLTKVAAAANKIKNGQLEILNANINDRLHSAEKIAASLLETFS